MIGDTCIHSSEFSFSLYSDLTLCEHDCDIFMNQSALLYSLSATVNNSSKYNSDNSAITSGFFSIKSGVV